MQSAYIILFGAFCCAVMAYPQPNYEAGLEVGPLAEQLLEEEQLELRPSVQRVRRQTNQPNPQGKNPPIINPEPKKNFFRPEINIQGGGTRREGIDLGIGARAPVWQSKNERHSVDLTGQYGQHFGGPWGNSRPSWGAGAIYRYRF